MLISIFSSHSQNDIKKSKTCTNSYFIFLKFPKCGRWRTGFLCYKSQILNPCNSIQHDHFFLICWLPSQHMFLSLLNSCRLWVWMLVIAPYREDVPVNAYCQVLIIRCDIYRLTKSALTELSLSVGVQSSGERLVLFFTSQLWFACCWGIFTQTVWGWCCTVLWHLFFTCSVSVEFYPCWMSLLSSSSPYFPKKSQKHPYLLCSRGFSFSQEWPDM